MKTSLASILFLSLFFFFNYEEPIDISVLFGEWNGQNDSLIFNFNFIKDDSCKLIMKNKYSMSTSVFTGRFILDMTKSPIPITINKIQELNYSIHTIMMFKGKDKLLFGEFSQTQRFRPVSFGENPIMLTKIH